MKHSLATKRLTMREAAQLLNVHVATIWRWALHGVRGRRLRTYLIGGRRHIALSDLEAFVETGESNVGTAVKDPQTAIDRSAAAAAELAHRGVP